MAKLEIGDNLGCFLVVLVICCALVTCAAIGARPHFVFERIGETK